MKTPGGLAYRLSQLRTSKNLTLAELARRADISKATLSHWESGMYSPRPEILRLVLDVLQADAKVRAELAGLLDRREAWTALGLPKNNLVEHGCLADLLAGYRIRSRKSQRQVADELGVCQSTVARWELGDLEPSSSTRAALARTLGLSAEEAIVFESISNHEEPVVLRIQRATSPPDASEVMNLLAFEHDRSDIVRMRAALHQARRRLSADDRWDEVFAAVGERLMSRYMMVGTNNMEWSRISRELRADLGQSAFQSFHGQQIVMCNYIAHWRLGPLSIEVALHLAQDAKRLFFHLDSWPIVTATGIAAEVGNRDLALALATEAEMMTTGLGSGLDMPAVLVRYLNWAGLYANAMKVVGRWSSAKDAYVADHPKDPQCAVFFQEASISCRGLGDLVGAADYNAKAERILKESTSPNNLETVASIRRMHFESQSPS